MLDTVALEFVTVGCAEDFVSGYLRGNDLTDDIFVGEADDETVLGGIVFVLGLGNETLASVIIGFTCTTTLVFGLVATGNILKDSQGKYERGKQYTHL